MDRLKAFVTVEQLREVIVGGPADLSSFNDQQLQRVAIMMAHCCLNGPVGVKKITSFPVIGEGSIITLSGYRWTNKNWANTCELFAVWLKSNATYAEFVKGSQHARVKGDLWPLAGK